MSGFKNYQFYNFQGGLDFKNSAPLVEQTEKRVAWGNSYNVELLENGGITKMKGSQLVAEMPDEIKDEIIGGFEGEKDGSKFMVIVTKGGSFYMVSGNNFILKKSGMTAGAKPNFRVYLNGVFVSNGADEPFLFEPAHEPEILPANCTTSGGHAIRGNAIEVYKGRIWIADGATLYYSALGKYNDWTSENDAGSISNFHNDTSPITALCCYQDCLVVHKKESSFILSGNSPDNFVIKPFSNLGAISPFGINTANGRHLFFNRQVYPFQVNELGEIVQGSAVSLIIENKLSEFDNQKNNTCMLLNYKNKSQMWCFLYKSNQDYFSEILIYDYINNAWFLRKVPYQISSAWEYDGIIYCGLKDGSIIKEAVGSSFLGQPVEFLWTSPFFHFGQVNISKTVEELALVLYAEKDNNFQFQTKKDYSGYEIFDRDSFYNVATNTLVYCDNNGNLGQGVLDGNDEGQTYGFVTLPASKVSNYLTNITGSNKSVQIQLFGKELHNSLALLGLEFREVYFDA